MSQHLDKALAHAHDAEYALKQSHNCITHDSRDAYLGLLELAHHEALRCAEALATELVKLAVREDAE